MRSSTQKLDTNKYVHVNYNVGALQRYVFHLVSYSINIQYLYILQKFLEISTKNDSFERKWYLQPSYDPNQLMAATKGFLSSKWTIYQFTWMIIRREILHHIQIEISTRWPVLLGDINAPKRSKKARFFFLAQLSTQELFKTLYRVIVPVLKRADSATIYQVIIASIFLLSLKPL